MGSRRRLVRLLYLETNDAAFCGQVATFPQKFEKNNQTKIPMKRLKKMIAIVACMFTAASSVHAETYPDISIKDLKKAIQEKKVIVLDVNGSKSYAKGHVPTAIDFASAGKNLETVLKGKDKETLVVAYCGGPSCGAYKKGAAQAKALGFKNVKHLSAGISGWLLAGEKTEKAKASAKG